MAQNVISQRWWPWNVKIIGQNKWHHQIPWPWKYISRCQNRHPKCLSSKVMVKDLFLHNGGQRNTFAYVSRSNPSGCFFIYWKALTQIKRNSLTDVRTLWRKLRHEGEIWRKSDQHIIWRSFPEPSFGISWGSIHWAVIEIELPKLCLKSWELL